MAGGRVLTVTADAARRHLLLRVVADRPGRPAARCGGATGSTCAPPTAAGCEQRPRPGRRARRGARRRPGRPGAAARRARRAGAVARRARARTCSPVDDRYALVRSRRRPHAQRPRRSAATGPPWRAAGRHEGVRRRSTRYAAIVVDERARPDHRAQPGQRRGAGRRARTDAKVLAVGPGGLIIGDGRDIGLPSPFGCRPARRLEPVSAARPGRLATRTGAGLGLPLMSRAAAFSYSPLLPLGDDLTEYRLVTDEGVDVVNGPGGRRFLTVEPAVLTQLTAEAMHDIAHFLRPAHLAQLRSIIDDPKASPNDRFVALDLLRNANIAAGGVLPMCQDTGTAIVMGKRGRHVLTDGADEQAIARGRLPGVHPAEPALLAARPADHVGRAEHRHQPAGPDRAVRRGPGRAAGRVQVPVHGQGRRLGQQVVPVPGDQGAAEPGADDAVPGREAAADRHRGLPAVPPGRRDRRHQRRARAEDREAGLARSTWTTCRRPARCRRTASATSSWRPRCWS